MPLPTITIDNINLQPEIEEWRDAYCGEDVRQANIDAFNKIQDAVNGAIQGVTEVANQQVTVVNNAEAAVNAANETLTAANTAKESAEQDAQSAAEDAAAAATAKNDAETAAANAEKYSQIVAPAFWFDINEAKLYMKSGVGMDFYFDEDTGKIYWRITP